MYPKRNLILLEFTAIAMLIASAITSAMASGQGIRYINDLSNNLSYTLQTQLKLYQEVETYFWSLFFCL